jgi:hypothetical protein
MAIVRSTGVTRTERLLADLCERSFLKLWSYPNPFKDDRDELCDLLAVFEDHVFIFFDRENRQLDAIDKDPLVNWERWKRKVIDAQIRTAHGAERYIRSGRGVFLDKASTVPFPLNVDPDRMIVHKIIVAHGADEACKNFSDSNVYGSLAVAYDEKDRSINFPFMVNLDRANPVHIFDSHNLPILFDELDTFYDLTAYLDAKVEAIRKFKFLMYCGEEDLLAHYFLNFDEQTDRHFIGTREEGIGGVWIGEGEWKDFIEKDAYKNKKQADRVSYFWDEVIQKTCQNALDGTLLGNADLFQGQSAIREMAKEPRFSRRALSEHMIAAIQNFPETPQPIVRNLSFMPSFFEGKAYVFLQFKMSEIGDYENDYRPKRRALLEVACGAAKNKFPHLKKVIGIVIDAPKFTIRNSEDFILMNCEDWTEEQRSYYEHANEVLGFFKTGTLIHKRIQNFPNNEEKRKNKNFSSREPGRNSPCTCGSGKKYKRCCGRAELRGSGRAA